MKNADAQWEEVLWLAARNEPRAMQRLEELARRCAALCSKRIRQFVLSDEHGDEMGTSDLLNLLAQIDGAAAVETWIMESWNVAGPAARRKICSWAYTSEGMSTRLALSLFNSDKSTVRERHLLAAGLAASASERSAESLVLGLLPQIGKYDDPNRQRVLEAFIASAQESFR